MRAIDLIVVHCSATRTKQDVGAAEMRAWHIAQGWNDIGYHYVIRRDGRIEKGRPEEVVGSHAKGFNSRSIGVVLVGGLGEDGRADNNFTALQFQSLQAQLKSLKARFPKARIFGHRDLSKDKNGDGRITQDEWEKDCPTFDVRAWCAGVGIATD